jgi:hypothetical protein
MANTPDVNSLLSGLSGGLLTPPDNSQPNYVMAPPDPGPSTPDAGPVVGMQGSPTMDALAGLMPQKPNVQQPVAPLWQRIVAGALLGAASGAGAKNFGTGMAQGSAGVLAHRQQDLENQQRQQQLNNQTADTQSNIRFRDAQAANLAIEAKMKDAQLQALPEQLRQQAENHALGVMQQFQAMGIQPRLSVPDTSKDAVIGMQQLHNSDGSVPSLFTVHAGNQIVGYDLNQLTQTPQGLNVINQAGAAQGRPAVTQSQWLQMPPAARTELLKQSMNFFNPTPSKENAPVLYQQYKNYLDTYAKKPDADPATVQRLQGSVQMLGQITKGLQDLEVQTENRKSANSLRNQIAAENYRDLQKDSRTYGYATDTRTGEMFYVNKAQADKYGLGGFELQTPATLKSDIHDFKVLNDVAQKSNMVRDSLEKVDPKSLGPLARILNNPKYADPQTGNEAIKKIINQGILSKDAQDYANNVLQLRESAMGLQKVLTGSARANEVQIKALLNTLPGIESSSDVGIRKLGAFNQNISRLREGMPSAFPGLPMIPIKGQEPQRVVPAGATPGRDANGNIIGYKTQDGKVVRF